MIGPEEIRRKALNLYPAWQIAWLSDEAFFPRVIPCDKRLDENLGAAIESISRLRAGSKELRGFGYSIEWKERKSRLHGRNLFPTRIMIESADDFLRLIGKQQEFATFAAAVERIRDRFPELLPWIRSHRSELVAAAGELDGLLEVVEFFLANPRPGQFARELPLSVDTKFIERNAAILRAWLDRLLPPPAIRADEEHFFRRFGLRYVEPLILVRFLDGRLREEAGIPWEACAVPLHSLAETPVTCRRILIVENKTNLFSLPSLPGTLGLGGMGNSVTDLRYLLWLADKEIWYWGDVDVEGFEILSRLRAMFPRTRSVMMDEETVKEWRARLGKSGIGRQPPVPASLAPTETIAFEICARENLRIEQEQLPQEYVLRVLFAPQQGP